MSSNIKPGRGWWTRRHFLWTAAGGSVAALLAGCGGAGKSLENAIGGGTGEGSNKTNSRALVYGAAVGPILEEYNQQYRMDAASAGSDPYGYALLIIHGPSFPGQMLKEDPLLQKAISAGTDIAFLAVTAEQKEAALKGRVNSYTKNDSKAYHLQFTKDANGRPSVRGTDIVDTVVTTPALPATAKRQSTGLGAAAPALGAVLSEAALFTRIVRGGDPKVVLKPDSLPVTRDASNTNGTIPAGAAYSRDSHITILTAAIPSLNNQNLYLIASHEVVGVITDGIQGAGFNAVLFTDGFIHSPPTTKIFVEGSWDVFGCYPVAVTNNVTVTPSIPLGADSLTVDGSPNQASGETDSLTDSVSFSVKSNGVSVDLSSSHTRTLTDWGFTPTVSAEDEAGFLWGQQVPYHWDKPDSYTSHLKAIPIFAYGGFAFHNSLHAQTNEVNAGTLDFTGALTGTFHTYYVDEFGDGVAQVAGIVNGSYSIAVDFTLPSPSV